MTDYLLGLVCGILVGGIGVYMIMVYKGDN